MISLEQVRQLDIRVKKAVAALKTLSAENAALKQRIGELQNEEAARAADEEQLEVSLQGVLDVLDEVDEETSELIADDPLGEVMDGEDDLRGPLENTGAEHDEAEAPPGEESPADEAGGEGHRADAEAALDEQQPGNREADEAGGEAAREANEAAGRRDEPGGEAARPGDEPGEPGESGDKGPEAAPRVISGEALPPDPGIAALSSESAEDENESAAQEVTPDKGAEDESPDNPDGGNPGQTEFDIF